MKRQLNVIRNAVAERFPHPPFGRTNEDMDTLRASVIAKLKLDNPNKEEEHICNPVDSLYLPAYEFFSSVMQASPERKPIFIGISAPQGAGIFDLTNNLLFIIMM